MPRLLRRLLPSALLLALIAVTVVFLLAPGNRPAQIPALEVTVIHAPALQLAELRGRPVFVTFWSTTCAICHRERPLLAELYRELGPSGLEIIAVAMSYDPPNRVATVREREGIPFPVALDIDARLEQAFGGIVATPTSFLFAPDGKLVYRKTGASDMGKLRQTVLRLLAEQQQAASGKPGA